MIKTTIIGGALFLVPVVAIVLILGKAYQFAMQIAAPLGTLLPFESFGGIALANILAVLVLLVICYLAGLLARLPIAKRRVKVMENLLLDLFPGYTFAKSMASGMANQQNAAGALKPITVTFDDHKQIAFEVDRTSQGDVVVYLPGAPNPWSGSVALVDPERVEALDMKVNEAIKRIRFLGREHSAGRLANAG